MKYSELTDEEKMIMLDMIHHEVSPDLLDSLDEFFSDQKLKRSTILATMLYIISSELYTRLEEDHGCFTACVYGDYIHYTLHRQHEELGPYKSGSEKSH